ncbi:helix-turn-helix domain-containing protein [Actinomadura adrarensis]|uniref:Helix-turn-helix domain-containing protein n=1 Tax=Actinomadura adrarensis TaxID=1819600 RepID=A0ABW3CQA9_9ACTN
MWRMAAQRRKRTGTSPTLLAFGHQLRRLRNASGLSQERLASHLSVTGQYVYLVEKGQTRCKREFAAAADKVLNADGALVQFWLDLVMDAAYPTWFDWPSVEAEARDITGYSLAVVDGLFQTPEYASAILGGHKEAVDARLKRQEIWKRTDPPPPGYSLLLDEAALVREVGSPQIMHAQLEHLVTMAADLADHLTVQVIPARGEHCGNSGSFMLATLEDRSQIAYVESAARGLTMNEPEDLATLTNNLRELRGMALPTAMSLEMIHRTAEEKWTT